MRTRHAARVRYFRRGRPKRLAAAVAAYRDSELLQEQARRAHQCAQEQFSIEAMGKALAKVLLEATETRMNDSGGSSVGERRVERALISRLSARS